MLGIPNLTSLFFFIISCLLLLCHAQVDESKIKSSLVEEIVQKVCNLSVDAFASQPPAEKAELLNKIEEKLNKSARSLGPKSDKYVKLILKMIKIKAFGANENDKDYIKNVDIVNKAGGSRTQMIEQNSLNDNILRKSIIDNPKNQTTVSKSKNELINDIAAKLDILTKEYINRADTPQARQKAIEKIKKKLMEAAEQRHASLHSKHDDMKTYVGLITKGIEMMIKRNDDANESRRMEFIFADNINVNKHSRGKKQVQLEPLKTNIFRYELVNDTQNRQPVYFERERNHKASPYRSLCDDIIEDTCYKINTLRTFICKTDKRAIKISKLCDGINDCSDFSDEVDCSRQAMESIQRANRLMLSIDTSNNCYLHLVDNNIISQQNDVLRNVLQRQVNFIQKYSLSRSAKYSRRVYNTDTPTVKKTVNEVATVVGSLSSALDTALCSKLPDNGYRKKGDDLSNELAVRSELIKTTTWSPENCNCNGQYCFKMCSAECERICWETYSLSQWQCQAVNGEKTVSIDVICDGKLDCYDETDEAGCIKDISLAKFEAMEMYNFILKMIMTKASMQEFEFVRNKLLSLHALIIKMQKLSLKRYVDILEIKKIREECFSELSSIYSEALQFVTSPVELVDIYVYLMSLNEKLVSALKRSHTGNDKIISSDGCVCRGYSCGLPRCSKTCIRACSVEPKFTRYFCKDSRSLNDSIPIEAVCNGKVNCAKGDDEEGCSKEVCRKHHLVVLRHSIHDVGEKDKGTALGEALGSWKTKVTSTLKIAENGDRPSQAMIRDIVQSMLHDLVQVYAAVDDTRRNANNAIFPEFYKLSKVVINALRSCSK